MKVLLTHDGSAMADVAVPTTHALAQAAGAEVIALCITNPHAGPASMEVKDATDSLDRVKRALAPHLVTPLMRAGSPGPLIVEIADEMGVDLIVMSTKGTGSTSHFLGSVADYVARNTHRVPVLFCRPMIAGTKIFERILLPLDGSAANAGAIEFTQRLASITGAGIVLLRLTDDAAQLRSAKTPAGYHLSEELLDDAALTRLVSAELNEARQDTAAVVTTLREAGLHNIVATVTAGTPGTAIVDAAERQRCDIIVLSSQGRGRGSAAQMIGSVADHVLQHVGEAGVVVVPPAVVPSDR